MSCEYLPLWALPSKDSWTNFPSYDPDYEQWEFGKLSALREIAFAQKNGYPYYYMGQYMCVRLKSPNLGG